MDFIQHLREKILDLEEQKGCIEEEIGLVNDGEIVKFDIDDVETINDTITIYEELIEELEGGI